MLSNEVIRLKRADIPLRNWTRYIEKNLDNRTAVTISSLLSIYFNRVCIVYNSYIYNCIYTAKIRKRLLL